MQKRVALLAAILVVVAPILTATPTEAAPTAGAWTDRQVLATEGRYHGAIGRATAVVADWGRDDAGRVIVFYRIDGTWVWQQTLRSPDPMPIRNGDGFGFSVDLHHNVIVVGQRAPWAPGGSAAHVFEYRDGSWQHAARLRGVDGWDVTVWGRFIAASSWVSTGYPGAKGRIVIFERLPAGWALSQTFRRGRDGQIGCVFGYGLDMQRSVLIVGDYHDHDPCIPAIHVFRREGSTWSREQRIRTTSRGYLEGYAAVWDDTIAVGQPDFTGTDTAHRARVRIYEWDGSRWVRTQTVRRNTQNFGDAVALHDDTLVVTDATLERTWVYTRNGGSWQFAGQFHSFGTSRYVAVFGRQLISAGGQAVVYRLGA